MPGLDRTGPLGEGPRTGRGTGRCGTGQGTRPRRGGGPGRGGGRGIGRGPGQGNFAGRGRTRGGRKRGNMNPWR